MNLYRTDTYEMSFAFMSISGYLTDIKSVFETFLSESEILIDRKQKELEEKHQDYNTSDEEYQSYLMHQYDSEKLKYHDLQNAFMQSGVFYLYSQFELTLAQICDSTKELYKLDKSLTEYTSQKQKRNSIISKSREYLVFHSKIELADLQTEIELIDNFRKLRNYLIHGNGFVIEDSKLIEYLKSENKLSFSPNSINLTTEYLYFISGIIFKHLHTLMERIYNSKK